MAIAPHTWMRAHACRIAFAIIPCLAACGGGMDTAPDGQTPPVASQTATVLATPNIQFTPGNVTLARGGTVTFTFGTVAHNVYFDNPQPGAPANITAPTNDASVTRVFPTAGTFNYNCHIHPGMSGKIIVQ